jgi:flagellar motor switch protein FliN/FliY
MADQQPAAGRGDPLLDASAAAPSSGVSTDASAAASDPTTDSTFADQAAIDELLKQATFDDPTPAPSSELPMGSPFPGIDTQGYDLPNFQQVIQDAAVSSIDLLRDVDLNVKIELGRSRMLVEDVLKLGEGSVVELDKLAGDPVDVFVNDRLVARGEVLVLNDNFCVRVNEIVASAKDEES